MGFRPKGGGTYASCFVAITIAVFSATLASTQANAQAFSVPETSAKTFDPHDLSGYWELGIDSRSIPPAELTPAAKAMMPKMEDADAISLRWCRPLGMPAEMDNGRPLSLVQGKYELLITFAANATHRHIYYRSSHIDPNIYDPTSVGDSIGHWEGDAFVVETIGFHAKNGRMLIPGGGYRTEKSKLVERFRLLKDGQILSVTSTWTDPAVFRTPHTYEYRYYRINSKFEQLPAIGCDPYDADRAAFVERTFSPALKKAAEAAYTQPGGGTAAK